MTNTFREHLPLFRFSGRWVDRLEGCSYQLWSLNSWIPLEDLKPHRHSSIIVPRLSENILNVFEDTVVRICPLIRYCSRWSENADEREFIDQSVAAVEQLIRLMFRMETNGWWSAVLCAKPKSADDHWLRNIICTITNTNVNTNTNTIHILTKIQSYVCAQISHWSVSAQRHLFTGNDGGSYIVPPVHKLSPSFSRILFHMYNVQCTLYIDCPV